MGSAASTLDRFLSAVHRRHVLLRLLERTGVCILIACGACAVLIPLLLSQGRSAEAPALWTLAMGGVAGLFWGSLRRPGPLEAAMEADRQLRLADLLGTALALRARGEAADPWGASVLATAEARCRDLSPSSVVLHRLGGRAWGGIGLATALVLAVTLLAGSPADTRAGRSAGPAGSPGDSGAPGVLSERPDRPLIATDATPARRPVPQGAGTDAGPDRGASTGAEVVEATQGSNVPDARSDDSAARRTSAGDGSAGTSGSGSSTDRRKPTLPPQPPGATAGTGDGNRSAPPKAGVGRASDPSASPAVADAAAGSTAGAAPAAAPATPVWNAPGFDSGARRAREALEAGRVPAAYRDIVRKYFDRP